MQFDLVTPEKLLTSMEATYVAIPGSEGSFGVLDGHQPTLATIKPGVVEVENGEKTELFCVGYGFVDVTSEKVTVLAEEASTKEDICVKTTKSKLDEACKKCEGLTKKGGDKAEIEQLECKIACYEAQLEFANS